MQRWRRIGPALALATVVVAGTGALFWRRHAAADPLARGVAAYDRGDYRHASDAARERLKSHPGDGDAVRLLARSSAREGRSDVAAGLFRRLDRGAWEAEDFFLLAATLESRGEKDDAYAALQEAIGRDPRHPDTLFVLARLDAREDNPYEAADRARKLAEVSGWEARGGVLLGTILADLSEPAAAADALEHALRLDPSLRRATLSPAEARHALARDRLRSGRPDLARAALSPLPEDDRAAAWLLSRALLQEGRTAEAAEALGRAGPAARGGPAAPEPAPFVGEARCAGCHGAIASAHRSSRHASTFDPMGRADGIALPDRPAADPHDPAVTHAFRLMSGAAKSPPEVETRRGGDVARAVLVYALGSGHRARTWIGRDDAGAYRELRLTAYRGPVWDLTTGLDPVPRPDDAHGYLGKPLSPDGLRRCLACHATDFRSAMDRVGPAASDSAIGCERCHGPGGNHVRAAALGFQDPAIARPRLASGEEVTGLCSGCHSPRGHEAAPDSSSAARFQGSAMTRSRCYTRSAGNLSCLTCHDPHRDAETSESFYEARCLGCHSATPPPAPAAGIRTRPAVLPAGKTATPCPVRPDRGCVVCHMPKVKAGVPHLVYTDHSIPSRPEDRPPPH
ncbi:tetratricopeptide repeat protein [Aquisphaera insulae]|uniref:tetratricopeptide repeat protein n=1 Tax=Aquisphaera insulae TaxID=2712864 RepID=UPI0013EACFAF|nr:tetratricopeptide repeat protein [Aquisphaera insulae]